MPYKITDLTFKGLQMWRNVGQASMIFATNYFALFKLDLLLKCYILANFAKSGSHLDLQPLHIDFCSNFFLKWSMANQIC